MHNLKLLITFSLFLSTNALATECIGSKDAKNGVVYLHGMDAGAPNNPESNRVTLAKIAEELHISIALPRAKDHCPTQPTLYCWGWDFKDVKVIDAALVEIQAAKDSCFPEATNVGLVGFSNGGYIINYSLKNCKKTELNWSVSIGAGSTWKDIEGPDMSSCGKYIFMVGKDDTANLRVVRDMNPWLTKRKVDYEIVEFAGGHTVPYEELKSVIQSHLPDKK